MKKMMILMLIIVIVLFGAIFVFKKFKLYETKKYIAKHVSQLVTITATRAKESPWVKHIEVVGSLRTVKGVEVTTELAGMIDSIYFKPGADVKRGQLLVQLNITPDIAKLRSLQADAAFAKITYFRNKKQYAFGAISKETLDSDEANYRSTAAQVAEQEGIIAKKVIRAPFSGRLGVSAVNPGQYLNPGQGVVTLETLSPIYVDFFLPQQKLAQVKIGQEINMKIDSSKDSRVYHGKVTTINPNVNKNIRNFKVEATLLNEDKTLLPGMFANVYFDVGTPVNYITLPYLAVTFNPYGDIVFLLTKTKQTHKGKTVWKAMQRFVTAGPMRGNQISVVKGIKVGDMVVTSGQLKLRNGTLVIIDNKVVPSDNPNPNPPGEQ